MADKSDRVSKAADTDLDLVSRAAGGDHAAFATLAKKYEGLINAVLFSVNVPEEDRNDLFQEGLIGLYKAVLFYDPALSSFSTFAGVCIRSGISDGLRRYQKEHSMPSLEIPTEEIPAGIAERPEEVLMGKETFAYLLEQAKSNLSPLERKVFGLHLQGKKAGEIARILGREQKSVENTLFRARKKLVKPS